MRRASFFIAARSQSADLLAAELALAIFEQNPKLEATGIVGKWSSRTRVFPLAEMESLQKAFEKDGRAALEPLLTGLAEVLPHLAVLVGYSKLHHELAAAFHAQGVQVVLYEVTPEEGLRGIKADEAANRIHLALSLHKSGSAFIRQTKIPFHYIGSPYRDRLDKIMVEAKDFGFLNGKPLLTFFPGIHGEARQKLLPLFMAAAAQAESTLGCQALVSVSEEVEAEAKALQAKTPALAKVQLIPGMHLELLRLSRAAITGSGAITIEAALAGVPFLPLVLSGNGDRALVNQSLGEHVIDELPASLKADELIRAIGPLMSDGAERTRHLQNLARIKDEFPGSAADRAAGIIARETGLLGKKTKAPSAES